MALRYWLFTDIFAVLGLIVLGQSPHLPEVVEDLAWGAAAALLVLTFTTWFGLPMGPLRLPKRGQVQPPA